MYLFILNVPKSHLPALYVAYPLPQPITTPSTTARRSFFDTILNKTRVFNVTAPAAVATIGGIVSR